MKKLAPARFVLFVILLVAGTGLAVSLWHPIKGIMAGFDVAALAFLASCVSLLNDDTRRMRRQSKENDANRGVLLAVSVAVTIVVLVAVGAVVTAAKSLDLLDVVLIVATLTTAWFFGNTVYALHYAHLYYQSSKEQHGDAGGVAFPGTKEPNYWDFLYFSFTLGMTFQTSDCPIGSQSIRRVAIGHCMAAFIFNLGVLAFTINALGS